MISSILKWGVLSGSIMFVLLFAPYFFFFGNTPENFKIAEIFGYVGMVGALLIIVIAITRHFKNAGRDVTIWHRLQLGLGITFVAGVIFGIANNIYTLWLNPEFTDAYYDYYISQLPVQEGPEFDAAVAEAEGQREMFSSPLMSFLLMAATVWMIGIVVSLLASIGHWFFIRRTSAATS